MFSTFATDDDADIQRVVDKINTNRDEVVLDSIYDAFKGETDPFGHPYGYTTLDGKTSDNMLSGGSPPMIRRSSPFAVTFQAMRWMSPHKNLIRTVV